MWLDIKTTMDLTGSKYRRVSDSPIWRMIHTMQDLYNSPSFLQLMSNIGRDSQYKSFLTKPVIGNKMLRDFSDDLKSWTLQRGIGEVKKLNDKGIRPKKQKNIGDKHLWWVEAVKNLMNFMKEIWNVVEKFL